MAQSANNPTEPEEKSLYNCLRDYIISRGITSAEQFFGLERSEIRKLFMYLVGIILASDQKDLQLDDATSAMLAILHRGHFENFRPLITVVLANKAKSNPELFEFINKEFVGFPRHLLIPPTRVRPVPTSSLVDSSSFLSHHLPGLNKELKKLMYTDVPGLVNHYTRQHTIDPILLLQTHQSFVGQKFEDLKKITDDTSEMPMLNWITALIEHLSTWLDTSSPTPQHSRTWRALPNKFVRSANGERKLYGAIMSQNFKDKRDIRDILIPVELKKNKTDAKKGALCLSQYVGDVFKAQPTRRFVIGLTLCGTSWQLWQFDRSGAIGSEIVDMQNSKENLEKFITLIFLFLTSEKQVLGFDTTFKDIDGQTGVYPPKSKIEISTACGPQELIVIDHPIFRARGICGRGTTCWQAHLPGDKSKTFTIKDSWQPSDGTDEGTMLRDLTNKNIPHVVQSYHHETVHMASRLDDIETHVRGGIDFRSGRPIQTPDMPTDPDEPSKFTNRVHRRLILKNVGQPIWEVDSPAHLLEALAGCIKGHQALLNAGYLHRDISVSNLLLDKHTDDPDRKSFLIDLDMAVPYPMANNEDDHTRIGTKIFMSGGLLLKEHAHSFVDDLESFFWVFSWIFVHYTVHK